MMDFRDLLFGDTETTSSTPENAKPIEVCFSFFNADYRLMTITERFNPHIPIPPESSAVHFIVDEDVQDKQDFDQWFDRMRPFFMTRKYSVGHNFKYDTDVMRYAANPHLPYPEVFDDNHVLCTLKLAKKLYGNDPSFENMKLSYLWFKLGLHKTTDRNIVPHAAEDDVYMTLVVYQHLHNEMLARGIINENSTFDDIIAFQNTPNLMACMPTGKYKGEKMADVPTSYLEWMIESSDIIKEDNPRRDIDLAHTVLHELNLRHGFLD